MLFMMMNMVDFTADLVLVPIPLISPYDSEGIRHAVPGDVATLFRIMSPPLGSERSDAGF